MPSPALLVFPHEKIRPIQDALIKTVVNCLQQKKHAILHAPTGLGKTAASLAPCIQHAIQNDLTIFFLTSRHTQHAIVLQTLKLMRERNVTLSTTSIIGKQWLCAQPNVQTLTGRDFHAYCKAVREQHQCAFYENFKAKNQVAVHKLLSELEHSMPNTTEHVVQESATAELCPYEISILLALQSRIIVTDYYYLLHPKIREGFLAKTKKTLDKSIIIIDEGHNLPGRARELMSAKLSNLTLARALKEAKQHSFSDVIGPLESIQEAFETVTQGIPYNGEKPLAKKPFVEKIETSFDYDDTVTLLTERADHVRTDKNHSALGAVAEFLAQWTGEDEGYIRYAEKKEARISLVYRCLDPSLVTKELIDGSYCTILMSGTLVPTEMYHDLLGFPKTAVEQVFPSPFPTSNRLVLVVPRTTTKFSSRSEGQYKAISDECAAILNSVPGSAAVFFPSYALRDSVFQHLSSACTKTVFCEQPGMSKQEKHDFLERFKTYKNALLLAVAAGSFGEGVDMPGVLKAVIVVGLPLERPNLETQELIAYYDKRFGKGWDYGYVLPALTKCLQNAGRCIRSETDRGVIVFLDERYAWQNYLNCIPKDWGAKVTLNYGALLENFFGTKNE